MTTVILHGLLGKKFGKKVKVHLGKLADFAIAVDSIKEGFRSFLLKLNDNNQGYCVHFEKNGAEIHVLPSIGGSGKTLLTIIAVILIVIAIVVAFLILGPGVAAFGALLTGTAAGVTGAAAVALGAAAIAFSVGVNLLITALRMPSGPGSRDATGQAMIDKGGGTSSTDANAKSFIFDNLQNVSSQGDSLPIGYGRMKISSHIIQVSKKAYQLSEYFKDQALSENIPLEIYD